MNEPQWFEVARLVDHSRWWWLWNMVILGRTLVFKAWVCSEKDAKPERETIVMVEAFVEVKK